MDFAEEQDWAGLEDLVIPVNMSTDLNYWTDRKGNTIKISDMSTEHIKNSIRLILDYDWRYEYLEVLIRELIDR